METAKTIYWPAINIIGPNAIKEVGPNVQELGYKKALVVTDDVLIQTGVVKQVTDELDKFNIPYGIFSNLKPNPTMKNVHDGLDAYFSAGCDFIISIGGGSPQDTAKGIAILATNGGHIKDYEGVAKSSKKCAPIVAINTTAGTASEVTINYVITNEDTHVKMLMIDKNSLPTVSINDPILMLKKPAGLTAATGMDALTHAIEAYVAKGSYGLMDAIALESIRLIAESLETAVKDGNNIDARNKMAYASFIAGLSFNNAGLGFVHSMAHQLGGMYDLPHGVCNAVLLPVVEEFNATHTGDKLRKVAELFGEDVAGLTTEQANKKAIAAIRTLSASIGIPKGLKELGVKETDFKVMAENALKDACTGGNPRPVSLEEAIELYRKAM